MISTVTEERPILLAVLAPLLFIYGILGLIFSLQHLDAFRQIGELAQFFQFIDNILAVDHGRDNTTLALYSVLRIIAGSGLWAMKRWSEYFGVFVFLLPMIQDFQADRTSVASITFHSLMILIIVLHHRDYA